MDSGGCRARPTQGKAQTRHHGALGTAETTDDLLRLLSGRSQRPLCTFASSASSCDHFSLIECKLQAERLSRHRKTDGAGQKERASQEGRALSRSRGRQGQRQTEKRGVLSGITASVTGHRFPAEEPRAESRQRIRSCRNCQNALPGKARLRPTPQTHSRARKKDKCDPETEIDS